jgi:hypothetical protein
MQGEYMRKKTIAWIAVTLFVLAAIVYAVNNDSSQNSNVNKAITKSTAEDVCQKEAVLKTKDRDIDVVSLDNYNPQFSETGASVTLSWNGKTKTGDAPAFVCELNGTDDKPVIKTLQMGAEVLQ